MIISIVDVVCRPEKLDFFPSNFRSCHFLLVVEQRESIIGGPGADLKGGWTFVKGDRRVVKCCYIRGIEIMLMNVRVRVNNHTRWDINSCIL